jgi:membrane-associated protease RseP (regulator of RpoE activity)
LMSILGAHEMGHYLACRYYRISATLPFFLPFFSIFGTLGAVIRIREPIQHKRALFDIGIAGPLAGLAVAIPVLTVGLLLSNAVPARAAEQVSSYFIGVNGFLELLLLLIWTHVPAGYVLNLHPLAMAGWFGVLMTSLNLFPVSQLDGGHITYAWLGHRSSYVGAGAIGALVVLPLISSSWLLWAIVAIVMVSRTGLHHLPVIDEEAPLGRARVALVLVTIIFFLLCFTPAPLQPVQLLRR